MNYSTISLNEWKQLGEGGNGTTYINANNPDILLKVSQHADGIDEMSKEFFARRCSTLGISISSAIFSPRKSECSK